MSRLVDRLNELSKQFESKVPVEFRFKRRLKSVEFPSPKKPKFENVVKFVVLCALVVVFLFLGTQIHKTISPPPNKAVIDLVAFNQTALQYYHSKNYPKALETFQLMLAESEDDPVILNNIGVVLKKMGEYVRAEEFLLRATEVDGDFATALNNLGMLRAAEGRLTNAFMYWEQASVLSKEYLDPVVNMALMYERQGKFGLAGKSFEKYLRSPTLGPLRSQLPERIRRLHTLARLNGEEGL